jgi:hypothetical protein
MADDMTIGMMMPQILNEDGSVQTLSCWVRLYIEKENKIPSRAYQKSINEYELKRKDLIYNVPLSGCFYIT